MRTRQDIESDLDWVCRLLHDSQEHAHIVRYEQRRQQLWDELTALAPPTDKKE